MAFFKFLSGDNRLLTYGLLLVAVWIAFYTILGRLNETPEQPQTLYKETGISQVSYIKLKLGMTQIMFTQPFLPDYSDEWNGPPEVQVNWTMHIRGGRQFSGTSIAQLKPPYDNIIFSVYPSLEEELNKVHSEELFMMEERSRIIYEVFQLDVELVHPETGKVIDSHTEKYDPEERERETWAY